jgi:general secretion pathway protein D
MGMRWRWLAVTLAVLGAAACAADETQHLALLPCPPESREPVCNPSKIDLKKSKAAFSKALRLQKAEHFDEAYQEFDNAARLVPKNVEYVTALALVRQQLVFDHLQRGNDDQAKGKLVEAQAEFRSASNLDPENEFAQQRLRDSLTEWTPKATGATRVVAESTSVQVVPNQAPQEIHFRGDSHALLTQIAAAYGVTAEFDDNIPSRRVHFDLDSVDFDTAMKAAGEVTGTFWVPLSEKQIFLARNNAENHRQFDHMALRTFYVPGATTPQDLNELTNLLRTIFDVRFVAQQPQAGCGNHPA